MNEKWKEDLRERFSDYSVPEPDGLWVGIEAGLPVHRRARIVPWLWGMAGVAAAAGLFFFLRRPEPGMPVVSGPVVADVSPVRDSLETPSDSVPELLLPPPVADKPVRRMERLAESVPEIIEPEPADSVWDAPSQEETIPESLPEETTRNAGVPEDDFVPQEPDEPVEDNPVLFPDVFPDDTPAEASRRPSGGVSLGLHLGGGGQGTETTDAGFGMNQTPMMRRAPASRDASMLRLVSAGKPSELNCTHSAPFRAGVELAWHFLPHWSLVSGVNYSSLRSTFTESTHSSTVQERQTMDYAGIPLRVAFDYPVWKWLHVYASAGGMWEKNIRSSSFSSVSVGSSSEHLTENDVPEGGTFWSVGGGIGVEARPSRVIGLFVEPGMDYHFGGSDPLVRNLYTDKPLQGNVKFGIRFNINP